MKRHTCQMTTGMARIRPPYVATRRRVARPSIGSKMNSALLELDVASKPQNSMLPAEPLLLQRSM